MPRLFVMNIVLFLLSIQGYTQQSQGKVILAQDLEIVPLSASTYLHISYLNTNSFGRVPCGVLYVEGKEALQPDTPVNEEQAEPK